MRKQKLLTITVVLTGVVLALSAGVFLVQSLCQLHFAENLMLREKPRRDSHWKVTKTKRGYLLQVQYGEFKNWYLAADELMSPVDRPMVPRGFLLSGRLSQSGPQVRNLILRNRRGTDCYWKITESDRGVHIQSAAGKFTDWYLDALEHYTPETGSKPPTAWNLILNAVPNNGAFWRLAEDAHGHTIQLQSGPLQGWYLDRIEGAKILERNVCWGKAETRDRPAPPLLKR